MITTTQDKFATSVKEMLLRHPRLTTVTDLAAELGYHRNTVSRAIHGPRFPKVIKAVCRELGLPLP
jgi:DNA-directed RNA polymerase specialized sigma54-like protein